MCRDALGNEVYRYDFLYDASGNLLIRKKTNTDGSVCSNCVLWGISPHGGYSPVGMTVPESGKNEICAGFSLNAHGDVVRVWVMTSVSSSYVYDAYGDILEENIEFDWFSNPFRYVGYYYDTETGLYYLKNRYYNGYSTRFMTEDPYWNVSNMLYGKFTSAVERRVYYPAVVQSGNRYAYAGGNPVVAIDSNGLEIVIVSGGITSPGYREDGTRYERFEYQFIETALNEIVDIVQSQVKLQTDSFGIYTPEKVTWIVMNYGYTDSDIQSFSETAQGWGVNFIVINEKEDFVNYINTKSVEGISNESRLSDTISRINVYSHGLIGQLGFGYDSSNSETYSIGKNLNFAISDIEKLDSKAFNNTRSYFYSCNTGTSNDTGTSFAQVWSNKTNGISRAVADGKTSYQNINVVPFWNLLGLMEKSFSKSSRKENGYSKTGSVNQPVPANEAKWSYFSPND